MVGRPSARERGGLTSVAHLALELSGRGGKLLAPRQKLVDPQVERKEVPADEPLVGQHVKAGRHKDKCRTGAHEHMEPRGLNARGRQYEHERREGIDRNVREAVAQVTVGALRPKGRARGFLCALS